MSSKKKPNIILITIDALRADHLGFMGYGKNITPNLDRLSKESLVFSNAFSVGPITPYSFPGILTSTYPLDYQDIPKIKKPRTMISEVLKEEGYTTAAFCSNPFLSSFFGYNQGWDYFENLLPSGNSSSTENFLKKLFKKVTLSTFPQIFFWATYLKYRLTNPKNEFKIKASFVNQIVKDFIRSVKTNSSPFFIWINYMETHNPRFFQETYYSNKPASYSELIGDYLDSAYWSYPTKAVRNFIKNNYRKNIQKALSLYDQAIMCVDRELGNLIDFLKKENLYQDTIICLTSDHGEEFLEHGGVGHSSKLYNELLHVPLLIKIPGNKHNWIDKKISLIDLSPTLCDLVGANPPSTFKGKSLFRNQIKELVFHQSGFSKEGYHVELKDLNQCKIACQSKQWKYILDYGTKTEELYNLSQDPREQNNLQGKEPQILHRMREKIQQFEKENPPLSLDY